LQAEFNEAVEKAISGSARKTILAGQRSNLYVFLTACILPISPGKPSPGKTRQKPPVNQQYTPAPLADMQKYPIFALHNNK
jgi:hypothetical protein